MYIKMIDNSQVSFSSLSVGDVFVRNTVPYLKTQKVFKSTRIDEEQTVVTAFNCLNLATYELNWLTDNTEVRRYDSTLVIGAGKGEV